MNILSTPMFCGIELKASTAILVVLQGSKKEFEIVESKFKKIDLKDHTKQINVLSYRQTITSFFETMGIVEVGIKARSTKGEFSGGAVSFKIEGIIQTTKVDVKLVYAATAAANLRKAKWL